VSVQERHDGASPHDEQVLTGATILNMVDETGIKRRPLLKAALLLPVGGLGARRRTPGRSVDQESQRWPHPAQHRLEPVQQQRQQGTLGA